MVSAGSENGDECLVMLDSGADISVLPKAYADVGQWAPGSASLRMVDAQGKRIAHNGVTKARISATDASGKKIEMVEEFVLGNVQHPIRCAGRLLRRGWSIEGENGQLGLQHKERSPLVEKETPCNSAHSSLWWRWQVRREATKWSRVFWL